MCLIGNLIPLAAGLCGRSRAHGCNALTVSSVSTAKLTFVSVHRGAMTAPRGTAPVLLWDLELSESRRILVSASQSRPFRQASRPYWSTGFFVARGRPVGWPPSAVSEEYQPDASVLKLRYLRSFRCLSRPGGPVVVSQRRKPLESDRDRSSHPGGVGEVRRPPPGRKRILFDLFQRLPPLANDVEPSGLKRQFHIHPNRATSKCASECIPTF